MSVGAAGVFVNIGIILDNPKREIDGVLLIAYHLVRQGHEAYIIPMYQQGHDVPLLGLDGLIVNYARSGNRAFLRAAKELGVTVFVLDNEGSVITEKDVKTPTNPSHMRTTGVQDAIDHYLFWGRSQRDAFSRAAILPNDRLHVTGCPRYDVCSPHWRGLLDYPRDGYVLVNTNFSTVNPLFTKTAGNEKQAFRSVGWDGDYVDRLFRDLHEVFRRYLETVAELARRHPDRLFVIRPHPFEDITFYERTYAAHANVLVDGSGSVFNVIHHAACVLHLNCQTAVETLLLDKLPVSMEFLNTELLHRHYPLPSQISYRAMDIDELDRVLRDPEAYRARYPAQELCAQYVQPWFHLNDGNAAARVAERVIAHTRPSRDRRRLRRYLLSLNGCLERPRLLQRAQAFLANLFGSRAVSALRRRLNPVRETKYVGRGTVETQLHRIARHDRSQLSFNVSHARSMNLGLPLATLRVAAS
jgi:surface carbohydrate biosynthesis protein